jgi:hypothetical protein
VGGWNGGLPAPAGDVQDAHSRRDARQVEHALAHRARQARLHLIVPAPELDHLAPGFVALSAFDVIHGSGS